MLYLDVPCIRCFIALVALGLPISVHSAHGGEPGMTASVDWPAWRGPRGDGVSEETDLPIHWSSTDNVCWKAAIPGRGYSSPAIFGDRIFLTTCLESEQKRVLLCLSRLDGHLLWQREVLSAALEKKHQRNGYATATPATDGAHVYVAFLQGVDVQVVCYDVDGKEIWRHSPGEFHSVHGYAMSPVLWHDLVILNCDQDAQGYLVGMDQQTGQERWRTDRPNHTRSYCVPTVFDTAGRTQMVLSGSKCVASYDPATGKQLWIINGPTDQYVASLVWSDGVFFLTAGFPTYHLMGIRDDGSGDITKTHILWHDTKRASYVPSPIAYDHLFYVVSDLGWATCIEPKTGQKLWSEKLGRYHSPSPVAADGYLYFLDDDGEIFVLKAGPTFDLVGKNVMGEECRASPAISRGQIFIRTFTTLYCIGAAKGGH